MRFDSESLAVVENHWFFYWKCAPEYWEDEIRDHCHAQVLFIPINWGLHHQGPENFLFEEGQDLKKIAQLMEAYDKQGVFLFPLTPVPFLKSSGIPTFLNPPLATLPQGIACLGRDEQQNLYSLGSFHLASIHQAFKNFAWTLGQYFNQQKILAPLFGWESGYLQGNEFKNFLHDYSFVNSVAFQRFSQRYETMQPHQQRQTKEDLFIQQVSNLYHHTAKECLQRHWKGKISVSFAGADTMSIFQEAIGAYQPNSFYFEQIFKSSLNHLIPAAFLLDKKSKKGAVERLSKRIVSDAFLLHQMDLSPYDDATDLNFLPLRLFSIVVKEKDGKYLQDIGLERFLSEDLQHCYEWIKEIPTPVLFSQQTYFFKGSDWDEIEFKKILNLLLDGHHLLVDMKDVKNEVKQTIELFLLENQIPVMRKNEETIYIQGQSAQGQFIFFDSSKFSHLDFSGLRDFWHKLKNILSIQQIGLQGESIYPQWLIRPSSSLERDYVQIRRLSLFNPTTTKTKVRFSLNPPFTLLRLVEEFNAQMSYDPFMEVELWPQASVIIDFGVRP